VIGVRKIQHHMIISLVFAMLFLGLSFFPIKQVSADKDDGKIPQLPPEAQPPTPQAALAPPTAKEQKFQVILKSIKINNDHDPQIKKFGIGYQNDGEWKIGVLVNGQFRDLSPPGSRLNDARGGRTYSLSNIIQPIVLNVDKTRGALVISTIGQEIDGCNFHYNIPPIMVESGNALAAYYTGGKSVAGQNLATALWKNGASSAASGSNTSAVGTGLRGLFGKYGTYLPSDFNKDPRGVAAIYQYQLELAQAGINKICSIFNKNDAIGTISDTYGPPTFGVGVHSTVSTPYSDSGRDFVLTYEIKPMQQPLQSQSQQPLNSIVRDHQTTSSSSLSPPTPTPPRP
jgi:hypothetical protein